MADLNISDLAVGATPIADSDLSIISRNGIAVNQVQYGVIKNYVLGDLVIGSSKLVDLAVIESKIADGAVSLNKLATGALVASNVVNTPSGGITSTNTQAAVNELDTKKATVVALNTAIAGLGTMSSQNASAINVTGGTVSNVTGVKGSLGANDTKLATNDFVRQEVAALVTVPAGAVMSFAMNAAPIGWLPANGASVSTVTYASLFAAIGYTYGGSGGNFNLPDLRGEFIRGLDNGRGVDVGRDIGTFQEGTWVSDQAWQTITVGIANDDGIPGVWQSGSSGGGQAGTGRTTYWHRVKPRNIALLSCIKT